MGRIRGNISRAARSSGREHPDASAPLPPARASRKQRGGSDEVAEASDEGDDFAVLPGSNPYDKAVIKHGFSYKAAKEREEVRLLDEKIKQAKINTEQSQIALEKERVALQEARGALLPREEVNQRLASVVAAMTELARMGIADAISHCAPGERSRVREQIDLRFNSAMTALGEAVAKRLDGATVAQRIQDAFRNPT